VKTFLNDVATNLSDQVMLTFLMPATKNPTAYSVTDWYYEIAGGIIHEIVLKESGTTASFSQHLLNGAAEDNTAHLFLKGFIYFYVKKFPYYSPYSLLICP